MANLIQHNPFLSRLGQMAPTVHNPTSILTLESCMNIGFAT